MQLDLRTSIVSRGKTSPQYDLKSDVTGKRSMEDISLDLRRTLVLIAATALKEEQSRGFDKDPVIMVDNRRNKQPADVHPFGKIEMISRVSGSELLVGIYEALQKISPRGSGMYAHHHIVIVNNKVIAENVSQLKIYLGIKPLLDKDVIRFVNETPYAGSLERKGVIAGRSTGGIKNVKSKDKSKRAADANGMVRRPNGSYFLTWRSFQRKFKGNSFISFGFMPGDQLGLTQGLVSWRTGKALRTTFKPGSRRHNARYKGYYVYPTITVRIRGEGVVS